LQATCEEEGEGESREHPESHKVVRLRGDIGPGSLHGGIGQKSPQLDLVSGHREGLIENSAEEILGDDEGGVRAVVCGLEGG
jgi:hypothetical protein